MRQYFPVAQEPSAAMSSPSQARHISVKRANTSRSLSDKPFKIVNKYNDEGFQSSSTLGHHWKNDGKPDFTLEKLQGYKNHVEDIEESSSEEKDEQEAGLTIDNDDSFQGQGEPSHSSQDDDDDEEMFAGDKDVQIAELSLTCAKTKKKFLAEKQTATELKKRVRELKQSIENERKRYRTLEKKMSKKEQQILFAVEETTDLKQKLRKVSIDEPSSGRKSKKQVIIPEDLKEFKMKLRKVNANKEKLRELAIQIFQKWNDVKQKTSTLRRSHTETRKKYTKLLYECHELERWKQDMQKNSDLVQAQMEAMTNDMGEEIDSKLKSAQIDIENLTKELNDIREHNLSQITVLRKRNAQLRETFNELETQKDKAEDALQKQTNQSNVIASNLLVYKSQAEEHELTIQRWKCALKKNIAYGRNTGKNQLPSAVISENKDEPDTIDITLRVFKTPATGKLFIEISNDSKNCEFPELRRRLSEVKAVRQLFSENGELSDNISIILGDQELLIQSWQATDIGEALKAVIDVNRARSNPENDLATMQQERDRSKKRSRAKRIKEKPRRAVSYSVPNSRQQSKRASTKYSNRRELPVSVELKDFFFPSEKTVSSEKK